MVYNLALRLSGNAADAQDIARDAFLKAAKGLEKLRGEDSPGAWLYGLTLNAWKDRSRRGQRRSVWEALSPGRGGGDYQQEHQARPLETSAGAALSGPVEKQALEKSMAQLDPEDRARLLLREIEGFSYQEIAGITEKPLGTVKSGMSRAREALRLKMRPLLKEG